MHLEIDWSFAISDALFVEAIAAVRCKLARPILVGLNGSQGSGKSTTTARWARRLHLAGLRPAILSLDDFYMTRSERNDLAREVHPLLATRGVPGTHDIVLLTNIVSRLLSANPADVIALPLFDKSLDDRVDYTLWPTCEGVTDVVILEGWCVGAQPETEDQLASPVNTLERDEDKDGEWRAYVNKRLADDYGALFRSMDLHLMLRAPSFDCVYGWRAEQERDLPSKGAGVDSHMDEVALRRFIAHYERITRRLLIDEPVHLIADLDEKRLPVRWRSKL